MSSAVLEAPPAAGNGSLATTAPGTVPQRVEAKAREIRVVNDDSELSYLLDTARYEHTQRIALGMARASLIPNHLKGASFDETSANCFLVVNQSLRWGFDPFAVAPETYSIGGKLAYQGKLIAAVINARSNLKGKLRYMFNAKQGDQLAVVVFGSTQELPRGAMDLLKRLAEEDDRKTLGDLEAMDVMAVRLSVGQAKTQNQMWTKDPEQKLIYSGAIRWARRHRPEVVLGVVTEDDAERMADRAASTAPTRPFGPVVPHPTDEKLTVDTSTGQVLTDAERIIAESAARTNEARQQHGGGEREPDHGQDDREEQAPEVDLSTPELWREAMTGVYAGKMPEGDLNKMLAAVELNTKVKKPGAAGQGDRERYYTAAVAGKVGADGKIAE